LGTTSGTGLARRLCLEEGEGLCEFTVAPKSLERGPQQLTLLRPACKVCGPSVVKTLIWRPRGHTGCDRQELGAQGLRVYLCVYPCV
jgi:hypothetical protein